MTVVHGYRIERRRSRGRWPGSFVAFMKNARGCALACFVVLASCDRFRESPSNVVSRSSAAAGTFPVSPIAPPTSSGALAVEVRSNDAKRTPSGFFLVSRERLAELRLRRPAALFEIESKVKDALDHPDRDAWTNVENAAFVHLVTKDPRAAAAAYKLFKLLSTVDVRDDSYLGFGGLMRGAAFVLDYCGDALSPDQRTEIAEYLEKWTDELWFHNKGSGWGLADPGNNYYCAFVEGTAYAAYALKAAKRPSADKLIELVRDKIEGPKGSLAYLAGQGRGGDWHEGANYGERSKQRLFSAFAAIASMGGPNYFTRTPFTKESLVYALYQTQPGKKFLAPNGDLARSSSMDVTPLDRDYVQIATHWVEDPEARALGAWYLKTVAPTYAMSNLAVRSLLYRDVIFPEHSASSPDRLPLGYRSPGTDWVNARSGWDDGATSLTLVATPEIDQSHAHIDTGSFVLWRGGWQAADAGSYGKSGLHWASGSHNMIQVPGHDRHSGKSRGLVRYGDEGGVMYAAIDASNLFTKRVRGTYEPMLEEWTRELVFLRPDVLAIYDRVVPKAGQSWSWRLHFPKKPAGDRGRYVASNGTGSITAFVLDGGESTIAEDGDLADGGPSTAWRLDVGANPSGRILALLRVATGAAPLVPTEAIKGAGVQGVASGEHVVVFSVQPLGRPASLPFSYTVKGSGKRQHVLANMIGSCDIAVSRAEGNVTVRVSAGSTYSANEQGIVRFSD